MGLECKHDAGACYGAIVLAAEAAAHERNVHVEIRGLEAECCGHAVFYKASALLACPDLDAAVGERLDNGDVRLHEAVAHSGELIALLGQLEVCVLVNLVKLCAEGCIVFLGRCVIVRVEAELVAVANTSFDGLVGVLAVKAVSYAVKVKALVALYIIVYDCRAVLLVCLFGVEDIGQRLVFDLDELACGLGDLLGGCRNCRNGVADAANLIADTAHDELIGQVAADGRMIGAVLAGHDCDDAGELLCLGDVDALDYAVRDGAAENFAVDHALGVDIGGIESGAGDFKRCVLADLALTYGIVFFICHCASSYQPPHCAMGPALYTLSGLGSVSSLISPAACFFITSFACMIASIILV